MSLLLFNQIWTFADLAFWDKQGSQTHVHDFEPTCDGALNAEPSLNSEACV